MVTQPRVDLDFAVQRIPGEASSAVVGEPYVSSLEEVSLKFADEAIRRNRSVRHRNPHRCVRRAPDSEARFGRGGQPRSLQIVPLSDKTKMSSAARTTADGESSASKCNDAAGFASLVAIDHSRPLQ